MIEFFKKIFGSKPTVNPCADAPYKVETSKPEVAVQKPKTEKKPVVKKATTRKPKAPKAPKV